MTRILDLAEHRARRAAGPVPWDAGHARLLAFADGLEAFCRGLEQPLAEARAAAEDHRRAQACYRADGSVDMDAYQAYLAARSR